MEIKERRKELGGESIMKETNKTTVKAAAEKAVPVVKAAAEKAVEKAAPVAKAATEKAAPVVKAAAEKTAPVVKAAAEKAAPVTKAAAEKAAPVAKAATEKAASAKKAVKTATKKATAKKEELKATVSVQFDGKSYTTEELVKIAKDVWKYDLKKKVSDFKTVELFVKPEESLAYYVINGEVMGSFGI